MCCGMDKVLGENLYFGLCSYIHMMCEKLCLHLKRYWFS